MRLNVMFSGKKKKCVSALFLLMVLLVVFALPVAAATNHVAQAAGQEIDLSNLVVQLGGLSGFAALVSFLVNTLKYFGIVKDGEASRWSAGFNLLGLAGLLFINVYKPGMNVTAIDSKLSGFVQFGVIVFSYVTMLIASKGTHFAIKGVPVIGTSATLAAAND